MAADHTDGPASFAFDKTADIADLFSWPSTDGKTTYLIMTVGKDLQAGAKFSDATKYVFHTASMPAYGAAPANVKPLDIICTFDAAQMASCWVGTDTVKEYVTGDASKVAGLASADGKLKVFAGLRDDPFFFNLTGFKHVASQVHDAAGGLSFDASKCPDVGATGPVLATNLTKDATGANAGVDDFKTFNNLAIVLALDTKLVTSGGPIVSVWASTNK